MMICFCLILVCFSTFITFLRAHINFLYVKWLSFENYSVFLQRKLLYNNEYKIWHDLLEILQYFLAKMQQSFFAKLILPYPMMSVRGFVKR